MDIRFTDYKTAKETAEEWGVSPRMIHHYCASGRIPGAIKAGRMLLIPRNTAKPIDERRNNHRHPKKKGE